MDRVSSCEIYVNQPDTRCFMIEFIHNTWWLDMFRITMVRLQERLQAVCCKSPHAKICNIQLVNAPEDGPLGAETCRATKCYE